MMKEYVSFECTQIDKANQNDPDERNALAYADIDGYPKDEDAEGAIICRVWLLKEISTDGSLSYIVDWHYDEYRTDDSVNELIREAEKDLKAFKDQIMNELFDTAYERYKLKWMLDNKCTLTDLMSVVASLAEDSMEEATAAVWNAFDKFEKGVGFPGSMIWGSKEEFKTAEYRSDRYMKELLTKEQYLLWLFDDVNGTYTGRN